MNGSTTKSPAKSVCASPIFLDGVYPQDALYLLNEIKSLLDYIIVALLHKPYLQVVLCKSTHTSLNRLI